MIRSKVTLALAACLAGVASGSIAVATADTSAGATGSTGTAASAATITVNGAGNVSVDPTASSATIQASYLTALGSAMTDAKAKATALSAQVGDALGAVSNITEQSNDGYACSGPMFAAGTAKGAPVPAVSPSTPKKHHSSKPKATAILLPGAAGVAMPTIVRAANTTTNTCTIQADVTVTYAMAPAA